MRKRQSDKYGTPTAVPERVKEISDKVIRELLDKQTDAERKFRRFLDARRVKYSFQHPFYYTEKQVDGWTKCRFFIADFYLPESRIVVEIDGSQHGSSKGKRYDAKRKRILQNYCGVNDIIRFTNDELFNHERFVWSRVGLLREI